MVAVLWLALLLMAGAAVLYLLGAYVVEALLAF